MSEKDNRDEIIHRAEKARIEAETEKFSSEKRKLDLEVSQIRKNLNRPWYRKEKTIQAFVAGIISFPILWFFFSEIVQPVYQRENIELSLENRRQELKLQAKEDSLQLIRQEFERMSEEAKEERKLAWDELEAMREKNAELLAQNEKLLADFKARKQEATSDDEGRVIDRMEDNIRTLRMTSRQANYDAGSSLQIREGLLKGDGVEFRESPNKSGSFKPGYPDAIVFHYSATSDLETTAKILSDPQRKSSVHILIGRDGRIIQLVPFNTIAWHAGRSSYGGRTGYNNFSIGIELINAGQLTREGDKYRAWFGKSFDASEVARATTGIKGNQEYWHQYTPVQIERAREITRLLTDSFKVREILGNNEIAPGRKIDPGPLFPLDDIRKELLSGKKIP